MLAYTRQPWVLAKQFQSVLKETVHSALEFNGDFYAFFLDPEQEEHGWEPHRDRNNMPFEDIGQGQQVPLYVTCWVALSEASEENGCIRLLPASHDTKYYCTTNRSADVDLTTQETKSIICLPAKKGSVIAWSGRTWHMGGKAKRSSKNARISLAFAASAPVFEDASFRFSCCENREVSSTKWMPSLLDRLRIIATQLWIHDHREPMPCFVKELLEMLE